MRCGTTVRGHVPHGVAAFLVLWYLGVVGFRVDGDDVPGVEEAWDVAQYAEGDVDEGISAADATLDPYLGDR